MELGPGAAAGEPVEVTAAGALTIHGVTNEVEVALEAQLVDGTAVVVGSIPIVFSDYDVEPPTAPVVVSVADEGTVEFQLLFTPAVGRRPQGKGERYRATVIGPGVTPDVMWEGSPLGSYDRALDLELHELQRTLYSSDRLCKPV